MIQSYRKFETTVLVRMGSWPFGHSQLPRRIFLGWGAQKLTPLDAHTEGTPAACSRMEGGGVNPLSQHLLRDAHTMSSTSWLLGSRQPHRHHANPQESHSLVKEAHTCSLSLSALRKGLLRMHWEMHFYEPRRAFASEAAPARLHLGSLSSRTTGKHISVV